jgi:hypothetical protein
MRKILTFIYGHEERLTQSAFQYAWNQPEPKEAPSQMRPYKLVDLRTAFGPINMAYGKH